MLPIKKLVCNVIQVANTVQPIMLKLHAKFLNQFQSLIAFKNIANPSHLKDRCLTNKSWGVVREKSQYHPTHTITLTNYTKIMADLLWDYYTKRK